MSKGYSWGVGLSILYLGVAIGVAALGHARDPNHFKLPAQLNEWGDVLAGFFSPLAFLWLVIGYRQQGEELKLNSDALLLQAEELRHQVQTARELLEHERKQALKADNIRYLESLPNIRLNNSGRNRGPTFTSRLTLTNTGAAVTGARLSTITEHVSIASPKCDHWANTAEWATELSWAPHLEAIDFVISYTTNNFVPLKQYFKMVLPQDGVPRIDPLSDPN
ncbi:hypothetical protein IGB42_02621 [Andreprevotia sp. IGB-42]|uniref:hypothetical protein n=1 Tax=Andreprevotia sp. IGB-42 TaxID=2497473 RepID=UPI00135C5D27|nr:hypothetical protein [Andreprevotia sp. IGB-42]KAF0812778.1 hypothetical protein IGB42_02621 [Andreprevotia sp. IGB-42]